VAIITISLTASSLQIGTIGVPSKVFLDTDIPSIIYYTLDGSVPTQASTIYVDGIALVADNTITTIMAFATNGFDVSNITKFVFDATNPQNYIGDGITDAYAGKSLVNYFPFGGNEADVSVKWFNNTNGAIYTKSSPTTFYNGNDQDGNPNNPSSKVFDNGNYEIVYNTEDSTARFDQQGKGHRHSIFDFSDINIEFQIQKTDTANPNNPGQSEWSEDFLPNTNNHAGNKEAHVRFQDCSKINELTDMEYNTPYEVGANPFKNRMYGEIYNVGEETLPPSMFLLTSHYIPSKDVFRYYYLDVRNQRWKISEVPRTPGPSPAEEMDSLAPIDGRRHLFVHPGYPHVINQMRKIGG